MTFILTFTKHQTSQWEDLGDINMCFKRDHFHLPVLEPSFFTVVSSWPSSTCFILITTLSFIVLSHTWHPCGIIVSLWYSFWPQWVMMSSSVQCSALRSKFSLRNSGEIAGFGTSSVIEPSGFTAVITIEWTSSTQHYKIHVIYMY